MNFSDSTWWWLIAGGLVALELVTGTFYLLMLAVGAAAAALAAHLGLGLPLQLIAAAVVGGGATVYWHFKRAHTSDVGDRLASKDVSLDIGEKVFVKAWQPDGTTTVNFRGSTWQARLDSGGAPVAGAHTIVALEGNRLMLKAANDSH